VSRILHRRARPVILFPAPDVMRTILTIAMSAIAVVTSRAHGQAASPSYTASAPTVLIPQAESGRFVEPHLVSAPTRPGRLLAVAFETPKGTEFTAERQLVRCSAFLSVDRGQRWNRFMFPVVDCMDP